MSREVIMSDYQTGELTPKDMSTLIQSGIVPKGVPESQVKVFAAVCRERGLSPFSKEIYLMGYKRKDGSMTYTTTVGIDGWRKMAKKDPSYAGTDDAVFDLKSDGTYKTAAELVLENKKPATATVTVYRMVDGQKVSYTHTAVFGEFNTGREKWATMPFQMISKVAESFAYRKAFGMSGVHIEEEGGAFQDNQETSEIPEMDMEDIKAAIAQCQTKNDFRVLLKQIPEWKNSDEILKMTEERNKEIQHEQV